MPERILEIKDYCANYCERNHRGSAPPNVVPMMFRMDFGGILFGFYNVNYNRNRAASIVLRKASAHAEEMELLRTLEDRRCATGCVESLRVVTDHVACWEGLEETPIGIRKLVSQLEIEGKYFQREQTGTRNLKPRIEQDIRNYNALHYSNRVLVPMIFELGRAGVVFGFFSDHDEANDNRGNVGSLLMEMARTFDSKDNIWEAIERGYSSRQRVRVALDYVTHYYSLMDMQELADSLRAKELVARIPLKPPEEKPEAEGPGKLEEEYLRLWGWEVRVAKDSLPDILTQDVSVPEIAEGIGRVLKTDVSIPAKRIFGKEQKKPAKAKKE